MYELMYMTMLHCYWQYTEATKNQPQTWLKNPMILPNKLGKYNAPALNPGIVMPIESVRPDAAMDSITPMQEPNAVAPDSIVETPQHIEVTGSSRKLSKPSVTIPEQSAVPAPSEDTEPRSTTELSVAVSLQPIEEVELDENTSELIDELMDTITHMQESNSTLLDTIVDPQKSSLAMDTMKSKPVSEPEESDLEENVILMEQNATLEEQSLETPKPNRESSS